ncbi:hypothetical protein Fmac_020245 [Flemingia macrophylla]|uniref:Uncharacterized protein n=1 Tax=Flemingia macrophylla TaxID=520843 RepID=A0ABD1LTG4_9FABA
MGGQQHGCLLTAAIKVGPCGLPGSRIGNYGGQVILPLAHTIEHEEEASNPNRTLDLASALDVGTTGNRALNDYSEILAV